MKKCLRTGLWLLLACASSSHAVEVILDGSGINAIAVNNLETSPNTFYDVVFEQVSYGTTPDPLDPFIGSESSALSAANALAAALTNSAAVLAGSNSQNALIPWSYADANCATPPADEGICGFRVSSAVIFPPGTNSWGVIPAEIESGIIEFARFTPSEVPLPPAVFLFASGLAVLGWVRRRPGGATSSS